MQQATIEILPHEISFRNLLGAMMDGCLKRDNKKLDATQWVHTPFIAYPQPIHYTLAQYAELVYTDFYPELTAKSARSQIVSDACDYQLTEFIEEMILSDIAVDYKNFDNISLLDRLLDGEYLTAAQILVLKSANIYQLVNANQVYSYLNGKRPQVIDENPINVDRNFSNTTPIQAEFVNFIFRNGFDINHTDNQNRTALYYATNARNLHVCTILLVAGADPNVGDLCMYSLFSQIDGTSIAIIELLLHFKADINRLFLGEFYEQTI